MLLDLLSDLPKGKNLLVLVQDSVLVIKPSFQLGCADCVKEDKGADGSLKQLVVPAGLNDRQLLALLVPYRSFRVWKISLRGVRSLNEAYAGFSCAGAVVLLSSSLP